MIAAIAVFYYVLMRTPLGRGRMSARELTRRSRTTLARNPARIPLIAKCLQIGRDKASSFATTSI